MKKICFVAVYAAVSAAATLAFAETRSNFQMNVNVGLPVVAVPAPPLPPPPLPPPPPGLPRVTLEAAPRFIMSPALGFYVSVGAPHDIVFIGNNYYLNRDGRWYRSGHYNGPWAEVRNKRLPPGLRKHRYEEIRRYRDDEYRRYEHDRNHYHGRWHEPGRHDHGKHDNGQHHGEHRGHHKGHDRD